MNDKVTLPAPSRNTLGKNESDRQIAQVIAFIKQEAREKAEEIEQRTEAEFQIDFLHRKNALCASIKDEYEKKKKDKLILKKIGQSQRITESRLKRMRERDGVMKQLKIEVIEKLAEISKNPQYPELIKFLIIQGLMTIAENQVSLKCRKEDLNIVRTQVDIALKHYQEFIKNSTGIVPKCRIEINTTDFLPPSPRKGVAGVSCCGGIILSARNETIICSNTLESRLDLCFEHLVPQMRGILFGEREKPKVKPQATSGHH